MQALRDELELRRKTETNEIEEVNLELEALPVTPHFSFLSTNIHTYLSQFCTHSICERMVASWPITTQLWY